MISLLALELTLRGLVVGRGLRHIAKTPSLLLNRTKWLEVLIDSEYFLR
jgi:hypothetical protein